MYDNGIPQSDNPIEAGETKAHGVGSTVRWTPIPDHLTFSINRALILILLLQDAPLDRASKVAPMPEETGSQREVYSGAGSAGHSSGKGGHEPKTLGEKKGLGSQSGV